MGALDPQSRDKAWEPLAMGVVSPELGNGNVSFRGG